MAAYTFSALFLAHVIADYLLQTGWMVTQKRRFAPMALHMVLVLFAMCLTTASFQWWFLALTAAHLAIDLVKTFGLPEGLGTYVTDQLLHLASVAALALAAPGIWASSPLSGTETEALPLYYMIAGAMIFAARGGQYACEMRLASLAGGTGIRGVLIGWAERGAICLGVIGGVGALVGVVVLAKALHLGLGLRRRHPEARLRLLGGAAISLAWGFAVALPLAWVLPMME